MFKCPNKNLPEWKEIEKVIPEIAYTVWDLNNGYGIDKAPNGEPSILFLGLLDYFNNDRVLAIKTKSKIYSKLFNLQYTDNKKNSDNDLFNISKVDTTKVDIEIVLEPWKDDTTRNKKVLKIYLKNLHHKGSFDLVADTDIDNDTKFNGEYSVHFKTGNADTKEMYGSSKEERSILFEQLRNAIPDGALVSTWGNVSEGGLKALNRVGDGWIKINTRTVKNRTDNVNILIPIYKKPEVHRALDVNGEPVLQDVLAQSTVDYLPEDYVLPTEEEQRVLDRISKDYTNIQKGISNRLSSVKRYTVKNPKLWNLLLSLITQLVNAETEQGMILFIEHVEGSIKDSVKFLDKPIDQINARLIRLLSLDYIGFYKPLMDEINYLVDTTDLFKDNKDYLLLKNTIKLLTENINSANNKFINILKSKGYQFLENYLKQQGMPSNMITDTINWLDDPKHDSSMFINWFGMATNSDNAVLQTIAKMLNDTKNQNDRQTLEVGIDLVDTLNPAKVKYGNDVLKLMYETLQDGTYSGLRVKPLNWGQLRKNQKEFLDLLATKLGVEKDLKGLFQLPQDESIQNKWFDALNKWYSENANRKYKPEYYTTRNKILSLKTREATDEILKYISSIVDSITTNGVQYDNLLSESEYNQLTMLRKLKQLLANSYNLDGSEKTGTDAVIAKELSEFNEIVSKNIKYLADKERYEKDRAIVAEKYKNDPNQLKLWLNRNNVTKYTLSFYDRIDKLLKVELTDPNFIKLQQRRRDLLNIYKDANTNKIDTAKLSDEDRRNLIKLDLDIEDVRAVKLSTYVEGLDRFSNFAEIELTLQYYIDMQLAKNGGTDSYYEWYNKNHYEDKRGYMHAASYYTELRPKEEFIELYTERVPSGRYTKLDPTSNWYNSNWDESGPAILPNKKLYDNSKAYNEMANKPEVKKLYDDIEKYIGEANLYLSFILFSNDSRMPLIPGRFMQALNRKDGILNKLKYTFEDLAVTKEDDLDFIEEFSTMPNGDPIKVIPTRFIKMLDDTNTISTDAVAATVLYYNMAINFKNMSDKLDDIELMLNLLKQTTIRTKKELKPVGSSNVYKLAQLVVDRLLYGRNKSPIMATIAGKELNVGKTLDITRNFITKVNLSGNIWSIGTSFFTDATYTTIESKMGRYFDSEDLAFARREFTREMPNMLQNIGNPSPKGKLPYLILLNLVVKDNSELFDRLDQSQVLRSINLNFWFMGYTQSDYAVKSHILISIYHNYRFVEGEGFLSKILYIDKFYRDDRKAGAVQFKLLKTTLYDAYVEKDGVVNIDSRYDSYVNDKLLNDVKNRIHILSKRIDGTIREVDKAGIHANSIASYLVMHRNFMVSALHDRFKKKLFNLDLGTVELGYYRTIGNIIGSRHFSLKQLLADYPNMEDYELYAVKRVLSELLLIAGSTTVAILMSSIVDGDDDYNTWLTQAASYLALRSAFEFRTMYNPFEFVSLIKSPSAAFNWFDNASSFINLLNPFAYTGDRTPFTIIDRGTYEGLPVVLKNVIKITPFKSAFEAQDPKVKRDYLLNQLMNF